MLGRKQMTKRLTEREARLRASAAKAADAMITLFNIGFCEVMLKEYHEPVLMASLYGNGDKVEHIRNYRRALETKLLKLYR